MSQSEINLNLHHAQARVLQSEGEEILFGGAAGGGKSHLLRIIAILFCAAIPNFQVYLFRRLSTDLEKNHMEGPKGFRSLLVPWVEAGLVTIVQDQIRFNWNGSKIHLCHCKDEKDRYKYQGAEIHLLLIDELTHFTETIYRFLRSRVRRVGLKIPQGYETKILCGSNPGGVGHTWVKATFVDPAPPREVWKTPGTEGGMLRQFVPARLEDNPSMATDDPDYKEKLQGLGSAELVKAYLDGDWNVTLGAYFSEFGNRHIIEPFSIPEHWTRFMSMDWGSAEPFSVGWWAVSDGSPVTVFSGNEGQTVQRLYPAGALIRFREWYGASGPNKGLKLKNEEVARGILAREERGERISYRVVDPSVFKEEGGPSIAEAYEKQRVYMERADNSRIPGWQEVRARLVGKEGDPMLYVFNTCRAFVSVFPSLPHDERRMEDLDTASEDHIADEVRYACMSRPWATKRQVVDAPRGVQNMTYDELIAQETEELRKRY